MKKLTILLMMLALFGCKEMFYDEPLDVGMLKSAKIENYVNDRILVKYYSENRVRVINVKDADNELNVLYSDPEVEYAEYDFIVSIPEINTIDDKTWNPNKGRGRNRDIPILPPPPLGTSQYPNDSYFAEGKMWGLYSDTINLNPDPMYQTHGTFAANAWGNGNIGSEDIVIGIIDEGIMWSHFDLKDNIWINPNEIANNSIDDDVNGFIDDVRGWDFMHNDNSTFDGIEDDHGTHVAGIAGAKGGNSYGTLGMVWNTKIITGKFLETMGLTSNAVLAFYYMIDLKKAGVNIVVINCSWGSNSYSQALYDAITEAGANGITVVCAAGNNSENTDHMPAYPGSYDCANIINVTAHEIYGSRCSWANVGKVTVDLSAPGYWIWSTIPLEGIGGYTTYSGTSMAAPHVTGAVALYKNRYRDATVAQVKNAILSNVKLWNSMYFTVSGGMLNVSNF